MRAACCAFVHFLKAERAGRLFRDDLVAVLIELLADRATCILQLVQTFDEHEYYPSDDEEVDDSADERAEIDAVFRAVYWDREVRDACAVASSDEDDEGLDKIADERGDDSGEGCADDDTDRHIHDITAVDKLFEFTQDLHACSPLFSTRTKLRHSSITSRRSSIAIVLDVVSIRELGRYL